MNYMRASLWLMVALFVSHAPYGEASLRQSLAFVPSGAFFWLSCHVALSCVVCLWRGAYE